MWVTEKHRPEEPGLTPDSDAGLSPDELEALSAEALPDREAMSLVDANIAIPIDPAIAANVLSDESIVEVDAHEGSDSDDAA